VVHVGWYEDEEFGMVRDEANEVRDCGYDGSRGK
jgi:hypothetical protein